MEVVLCVVILIGVFVIYAGLQSVCVGLAEIMYRLSSISTYLEFISQAMKKEPKRNKMTENAEGESE